jgi:hypothetical protein
MQTTKFAYLRVNVLSRFDFMKINTSRGSRMQCIMDLCQVQPMHKLNSLLNT